MTSLPQNPTSQAELRSLSIALLTFRRTDELRRAVESVLATAVPEPDSGWLVHEIIVIDNNPDGLAKPVVEDLIAEHSAPIRYVHEGAAGIVAGRNRALDEAEGNTLVFIDDDEIERLDGDDARERVAATAGARRGPP